VEIFEEKECKKEHAGSEKKSAAVIQYSRVDQPGIALKFRPRKLRKL
jgi:hypothetical protein